jgi:cell division GTPase FtsZ
LFCFNHISRPTKRPDPTQPKQINSAAQVIYENVAEDANIIFGAVVDEKLKDQVSITVLATGFSLNPNAQEGDNLDDLLTTLDQQLSTPRPKVGRSVGRSVSFAPLAPDPSQFLVIRSVH